MSFFGFDPVLPERRAPAQAADEDIAVYTWGTEEYGDLGGQLVEGGDEANDETFGDLTIGGDFQFANHAPGQTLASTTVNKPKKKKATGGDLFASTEADFFGFSKKSRSSLHPCPSASAYLGKKVRSPRRTSRRNHHPSSFHPLLPNLRHSNKASGPLQRPAPHSKPPHPRSLRPNPRLPRSPPHEPSQRSNKNSSRTERGSR